MLFDLRGRGRRRAVRVIYIGLAFLIGFGLVGFGVGGGFGGGGLFTAASNSEGGGSSSFSKQIAKYRKQTQKEPQNEQAWENLTRALIREAGREELISSSGALTSQGKKVYSEADEAWTAYLALKPAKPNTELAQNMVRIYGPEGLNKLDRAVTALQLIVAARPESAALYAKLAEYAYLAKNPSLGDLAAAKAVSLAPAAQRALVKRQLAEAKANPNGEQTTSVGGKTYKGKLGAGGTFTGTVATGTVQLPAAPSTTGTSTAKK